MMAKAHSITGKTMASQPALLHRRWSRRAPAALLPLEPSPMFWIPKVRFCLMEEL